MGCITMSLQHSKECPLCRHALNIKDISVILNDTTNMEQPENKLPTKIEKLVSILKDHPCKCVMVFSEYEASFKDIIPKFINNNITFSRLSGSSGRISNIIKITTTSGTSDDITATASYTRPI